MTNTSMHKICPGCDAKGGGGREGKIFASMVGFSDEDSQYELNSPARLKLSVEIQNLFRANGLQKRKMIGCLLGAGILSNRKLLNY